MVGNSVFLLSWGGTQGFCRLVLGPPLKLSWGDSSLAVMCRVAPLLLQYQEATH